jgi:prevent-host-death family protein
MSDAINLPSNVVGAYEAKTRLSELLDRVASGQEVIITRHGTAVAMLVPVKAVSTSESRRNAVRKMRELAQRNQLLGVPIRDLINEGRR